MPQRRHAPRAPVMAVVGLAALTLTLGGCGRQEAAPPAPTPSATAPPPIHQSAAPQSKATHQATLNAQSDYWRKHGQGLNQPKSTAHTP